MRFRHIHEIEGTAKDIERIWLLNGRPYVMDHVPDQRAIDLLQLEPVQLGKIRRKVHSCPVNGPLWDEYRQDLLATDGRYVGSVFSHPGEPL